MIFLNFSQLSESVFRLNFSGKHFSENQVNFFLTKKYFLLINFFNNKQIQKNLERDSKLLGRELYPILNLSCHSVGILVWIYAD